MRTWNLLKAVASGAAMVMALSAGPAGAQTVKVGFIATLSGPNGTLGELLDRGARLYIKEHEKELGGIKLEMVRRDDTGPNPDTAKRLAQELIVRDKVNMITGVVYTPNAAAIAPLVTEAKVPFVMMNAGTSSLTTLSPYMARFSFSVWQIAYPLGQWAGKKGGIRTAYTAVSDFAGGHDYEQAFIKGYTDAGGKMAGTVRIPLANPDFVPFVQRIKDAKPDAVYVFVPAGRQATQFMKAFTDLGLDTAGIKLIGPGDVLTDDELPNMGDVKPGAITAHHYSAAAPRPENRAFVEAWRKEYGANTTPNFMAVAAYDAMGAIFAAIIEQKGRIDPDKTMDILRRYKNPKSPRGPFEIDPETRDIVQNVYMRELVRVNGQLQNREYETIPMQKDYWKIFNNKK
jgi:branched-chain amino acid transport system substrate-binding protein